MMRSLAVGAELLQVAERRAAARASRRMRSAALKAVAGALALGALVFFSIAIMIGLTPDIGHAAAAALVGGLWFVPAVGLLVVVAVQERRPEPSIIPADAAERTLEAASEDFGRNSPVFALLALGVGFLASLRR